MRGNKKWQANRLMCAATRQKAAIVTTIESHRTHRRTPVVRRITTFLFMAIELKVIQIASALMGD